MSTDNDAVPHDATLVARGHSIQTSTHWRVFLWKLADSDGVNPIVCEKAVRFDGSTAK